MSKKEACLICGEDLIYFETGKEMECMKCHRIFISKSSCKNGHYICDECHAATAVQNIIDFCTESTSCNPIEIATQLMKDPYVYMHGPETHVLVGCALLTAYKNAGGEIDLESALREMKLRGGKVPGGACGFWGCCGAAVSSGIAYSILSKATPLATTEFGNANMVTSKVLQKIGETGGPRCCKRHAYFSIYTATHFIAEKTGVKMQLPEQIVCQFYTRNKQCIGNRCPFHPNRK